MKKLLLLLTVAFTMSVNFINTFALENSTDLNEYYQVIEELNEKYHSGLYILDKDEFLQSPIYKDFDKDYSKYLETITNTDIETFKEVCLETIFVENTYEVKINHNARSSLGQKTVYFNDKCNTMTLTYKYSGSKYDTSYKPTATVAKKSSLNYFVMSSYTGAFKNSNTTYSVTAKGKIYTSTGVANNKSFVVNFNL